MSLKNLSDTDKLKAFNMILRAYDKDSNLSEFGKDVQDILKFLKEMNK